MPKILPTIVEHSDTSYKDTYPNLKLYNPLWDLSSIVVIHKKYSGTRRYNNGDTKRVYKWGPYQFQCQACGLTRHTYEHMLKHQEGCKKLI